MTTPSNTLPEHWDQVGVLAYIYDRIAAETDDMDDCWWWCAGCCGCCTATNFPRRCDCSPVMSGSVA